MSQSIAIVGGTGHLGAAIAWRLARAGRTVTIGSRNADSAREKAAEIGHGLTGTGNAEAAAAADIVIVTVPFSAQEATLRDIAPHVAGKLVVDTTVPLVPPRVMRVQLPQEGSAAVRTQALLGEGVQVVSAFHNVAAHKLAQDVDVGFLVVVLVAELCGGCGQWTASPQATISRPSAYQSLTH